MRIPAGRNSFLDKGYAKSAVTSKARNVLITVVNTVKMKDLHKSHRASKYDHESNVNSLGQIVTRFKSTARLELNEIEITDRSGIRAMTEKIHSNTKMPYPNAFSLLDKCIVTKAPHPKLSWTID